MGVDELEHAQLVAGRCPAIEAGDDADLGVELGQPGLVPRVDAVDEVDDDGRAGELAPELAHRQHQVVRLLVPAVPVLRDARHE